MKSLNEYLYESYMYNDGLITEALKVDALRDFTKWVGGISSEATKKLNKMCKDINRIDPDKKVISDYYRDMLNDMLSSNGYKLNLGDINASIAFSEIDSEDVKILNGKTSKQMEIRKALKNAVSYDNNHIQYEFGEYSRVKGASGTSSIVIVKDTSTGDYKYIIMHDKGKVFTFPDKRYSDIYLWDLGLWKDQLESIPENIEDKLDNNARDPEYTFHDILRNARRSDPTYIYNVVKHINVAKAISAAVSDMSNREYIIITTNKTRQNKAIQRYDAREGMIKNTAEQNIELAEENRKRWKAALDALKAAKAAIDLVKDVSSAEPLFKRYISVFSKFNGTDIYNAPENRGKYLELMDSFVSLNNAIEYIKDAIENIKKDHRRASDSYYTKKIEVAKSRFNKCKKEVEDLLDELS